MSSGEVTPTNRQIRKDKGSVPDDEVTDCPVTGVVNRVELPNVTDYQAVLQDQSIETVMLSIDSVRKLIEIHDKTASTYFRDNQTVITTTTTHDSILKGLSWSRELDLIRRFGPDYHIPTEYSVYQNMPKTEQEEAIDDCMAGTEWFAERLENHSIEVLMQAKGWKPSHFSRCRSTMNRLNTGFVVFYATGYECRIYELLEDLSSLISQLSPTGILIIGKQSLRFLRKAPPEVVSVAGGRWRRKSGLEARGHSSKRHAMWRETIEEELSCGQATLESYN